jgi:hypothetical protein
VQPSLISSAYVRAPFDVGKRELEQNGYRIISLEESARLISNFRRFKTGFFVREGILYTPNQGVYITKSSPIMDFPEEATRAHEEERDFYLTDKQVRKALENSLEVRDRNFIIPLKADLKNTPDYLKDIVKTRGFVADHFADNPLAYFIFGRGYHRLRNALLSNGQKYLPIIINKENYLKTKQPFARQIYLDNHEGFVRIDGDGTGIGDGPYPLYLGPNKGYFEEFSSLPIRGIKKIK